MHIRALHRKRRYVMLKLVVAEAEEHRILLLAHAGYLKTTPQN